MTNAADGIMNNPIIRSNMIIKKRMRCGLSVTERMAFKSMLGTWALVTTQLKTAAKEMMTRILMLLRATVTTISQAPLRSNSL